MDSYQAVYDAVRSRISGGNIGDAVEQAIRDANVAHYAEVASHAIQVAASQYDLPSVKFRPKLFIDGDQWCALYGTNLQDGVAGFGDSPANAMWDFDRNWCKSLPAKEPKS